MNHSNIWKFWKTQLLKCKLNSKSQSAKSMTDDSTIMWHLYVISVALKGEEMF